MIDDIQIEIIAPDRIVGESIYCLTIRVLNTYLGKLDDILVEPTSVAGILLKTESESESDPESETLIRVKRLFAEMERQARLAFILDRSRNMTAVQRIFSSMPSPSSIYSAVSINSEIQQNLLRYASLCTREALTINSWEDATRIERDIISLEGEDSFIKKLYEINREKLEKLLNRLEEENRQKENTAKNGHAGESLATGASVSYTFKIRSPRLFRVMAYDIAFKILYRKPEDNQIMQKSLVRKITLYPSAYMVPASGAIGALCGYTIRYALLDATISGGFHFLTLVGSVLLGLVFVLFMARKPDKSQSIIVEDAIGGFIIGTLAGLFSEQVINKLGLILK